jgi:hypothetical protein
VIGNPFPLKANAKKSFQGSIVLGKGFVLEAEEAEMLIAKDPRNKDVLFPYLNGDDLNNNPEQKPSRWVINFFDWVEEKARTYPDCFDILEQRVKPERQRWKVDENGNEIVGTYALRKPLPQKWWIYGEKRPALYETISQLDQVMVVPLVSKYSAFDFAPTNIVYMHKLGVIVFNDFEKFAILSSTLHNMWCWKNSSTLGAGTLNYSTTDCFETFPFPANTMLDLKDAGENYFNFRKSLMTSMQMGLTKMYNQFHNKKLTSTDNEHESLEDKLFEKKYGKESLWLKRHLQNIDSSTFNESVVLIKELRSRHVKMDYAVLNAYKWGDIQLEHGFYDLDYLPENDRTRFSIHPNARKEILKRLLALNHRLHALEVDSSKSIISKKDLHEENSSHTLF